MPPPALHSELGGGRQSIAKFCSTETVRSFLYFLPSRAREGRGGKRPTCRLTGTGRLGGAAAAGRRRRFLFLFTKSGRGRIMELGRSGRRDATAGAAQRARRWATIDRQILQH